jgi:7,8-dihydropterin-6-yl-methyl-4-(beta-D-ribofuranosyl)aminobenzene 5'-phosphate synthase
MKKHFCLAGLMLMLGLSTIAAGDSATTGHESPENAVQVTIIYDNYQVNPELKTDWGFACLVEYNGKKLLFDAGRIADLYVKNTGLLEINPHEIPTLFISHEHGDHTAGIPWITEQNPSIKCYRPANSNALAKPTHMYGPYYSTGDNFAAYKEQGLVVKTETGGVLITGCGHPGAVRMIERAELELGIEIHTLIGGLHLMNSSKEELEDLASGLKELGIKQICPTHCTGDKSIAFLKEAFGEGYISGGTGKEIIIQ